jgi:hypothetical protein
LPDIPGERLVAVHIALLIEADAAEHGIELLAVQYLGDRAGLERACPFDRLRPDLLITTEAMIAEKPRRNRAAARAACPAAWATEPVADARVFRGRFRAAPFL